MTLVANDNEKRSNNNWKRKIIFDFAELGINPQHILQKVSTKLIVCDA